MTEYVVLLTGDEQAWEAASAQEQAAMFEQHGEFSRLLEERGHRITGGAQLDGSRAAKIVRAGADGTVLTTDGPYVESVEQLGGYYVVESDDLEDLLEVCAILARTGDTVEVRPCLPAPD